MKRNLILSAFLILDYSGSMDQIVEKAPKYQILEKAMKSYFEAVPPSEDLRFLVFGTEPKRKCEDIRQKSMKPSQGKVFLRKLVPGPYGMTPLASALERMGKDLQNESSVILITDGADTCGRNPCDVLEKLDRQLKVREKIHIDIIGFDLKSPKSDLTCFKDLKDKLKNFLLNLHNANDQAGLLKSLMDSRSKAPVARGLGTLKIDGAPDEAAFSVTEKNERTAWKGEFTAQLKAGPQKITLQHEKAHPVDVVIRNQELLKIPYSQFFKQKTSHITLNCQGLDVLARPKERTQRVHPNVKDKELCREQGVDVEFGEWTLVLKSPWWLKDQVTQDLGVAIAEDQKINMSEYFKSLTWMAVPNTVGKSVLRVDGNKVLIMPGTMQVPVHKKSEVEWLAK